MATFAYTARKLDGSLVRGSLPAETERAALGALDRMGLFPLELTTSQGGGAAGAAGAGAPAGSVLGGGGGGLTLAQALEALGFQPRIGAETTARFARELADLSAAGVPILKGLDAVTRDPGEGGRVVWGAREGKDDARARASLRDVRRDVAQGAPLHEALARRPELFERTAISLVRAGEAGGFLDAALRRVATFAEREVALRRRVRGALTYPAALCVLSVGAVVFLLTWVVPRFSVIYEDLGGDLPVPTQILMAIGDGVRGYGWLLALLLVGGGVWLARWLGTDEGRGKLDALLLRVPALRAVVGQACVARYCRTLGTLIASGVPILQGLEIARDAAGNREFALRLQATSGSMREGAALAEPLRATRLFPPQVVEMVEVAQETGNLAEVLERAADRADEEVDHALHVLTGLLEPLLVVTVAGVVFFVVVAALLPVFSLNTLVK